MNPKAPRIENPWGFFRFIRLRLVVTKKRLILIAALPLVIVAVTLGVLAMLPPGPGVTKANFDRIEKGMTLAQVELLLGGTGLPFHGFAHHNPPRTFVWS